MSDKAGRAIADWVLRRIRVGTLVVVEDGERREYGPSGPPIATVVVHSPRVWRMLLLRGSRGMADAYAAGDWDHPDLIAVIRLAARNAVSLDRARRRFAPVRLPLQRARALVRRSTRVRRRKDIAAHYDL